ncbi:MAG: thiamine pyrophosphate-dependent dehydrogenase E1 component subunit alpha [Armatimonadetes bacterium]|nr:thiamine pyrophosphate-dependent dehydrogenase E1 component subunit alpha [Armatimonadota bacterium]
MPQAEDFYRQMVRLRAVETELTKLSQSGQLRGSLHLCQGQEAVPAGACAALRQDDYLTCTYRGHGYVLAKGLDLDLVLQEILGKATGLCHGKGGKMHLFDPEFGLLGTNGIVGGGVGTAVGGAMASWIDGADRVALTVFGDGTLNQGHVSECFNMAALYKLPVIFLCENNLYAEMTPLDRSHGNTDLCARVAGFGIRTDKCDGNDPFLVHETMSRAVAHARKGDGPTFIEAMTYRTIGHYQADPGTQYRTADEVSAWREKSPIAKLEKMIGGAAIAIREEEELCVSDAMQRALKQPDPHFSHALTEVFA